eukprot:4455018-Prymnesium_polylepis.1
MGAPIQNVWRFHRRCDRRGRSSRGGRGKGRLATPGRGVLLGGAPVRRRPLLHGRSAVAACLPAAPVACRAVCARMDGD